MKPTFLFIFSLLLLLTTAAVAQLPNTPRFAELADNAIEPALRLSPAAQGIDDAEAPLTEPCGQVKITNAEGIFICGSLSGSGSYSCLACGSNTGSLITTPTIYATLNNNCFYLYWGVGTPHDPKTVTIRIVGGPTHGTNGLPCADSPSDILYVEMIPNDPPKHFQVYLDANGCCRVRGR